MRSWVDTVVVPVPLSVEVNILASREAGTMRLRPANVCATFEMTGHLGGQQLEDAVAALILRQPVLRSAFKCALPYGPPTFTDPASGRRFLLSGQCMQHVYPSVLPTTTVVSLSADSDEKELDETCCAIAADLDEPFNIAAPPLIRATAYRGRRRTLIALVMPLVLCDAISLEIIAEDFVRLFGDDYRSDGVEETRRYAAVAWQRSRAEHHAAINYWRSVTRAQRQRMPVDCARDLRAVTAKAGSEMTQAVEEALPRTESRRARAVLEAHGWHPEALVLSALGAAVVDARSPGPITIWSMFSNRTGSSDDAFVGGIANTLPVPVDVTGDIWTATARTDLFLRSSAVHGHIPAAMLDQVPSAGGIRIGCRVVDHRPSLRSPKRTRLAHGMQRIHLMIRRKYPIQFQLSTSGWRHGCGPIRFAVLFAPDVIAVAGVQRLLEAVRHQIARFGQCEPTASPSVS